MEPSEFDKLIKGKLEEKTDLHDPQMGAAKPFVWGAILNNLSNRKFITWYHLSAAVIVLLIGFSLLLLRIRNEHDEELLRLSRKMDEFTKESQVTASQLLIKSEEVQLLEGKLNELKNELSLKKEHFSSPEVKEVRQVMYVTDTVYVQEVEYITKIVEAKNDNSETPGKPEIKINQQQPEIDNSTLDDAIFLTKVGKRNSSSSETVQIKFGSFVKGD